jgi:hypothetical protein
MPDRKPLSIQEAIRAITSTPRMHQEPEHRPKISPGTEPAKVFEDRATPGEWRVEWFDNDGRCELEIFSGPDARRQALRYAMRKYGNFREVELEPHSSG